MDNQPNKLFIFSLLFHGVEQPDTLHAYDTSEQSVRSAPVKLAPGWSIGRLTRIEDAADPE